MYKGFSSVRCFGSLLTTLAFLSCSCTANCPTRNEALPLDLNQLSGEWLLVAGTLATGKSLSKCGRFLLSSSTPDTFVMNYTAVTYQYDKPVALVLNANVGDDVVGNIQFRGSKRALGPYKMRVVAVDYESYLVMVVCAATNAVKDFSMILSRDADIPPTILLNLKRMLGPYFSEDTIVDVDHSSCQKI